jgi:uncharacterized protein YegP (UPF0339 family)
MAEGIELIVKESGISWFRVLAENGRIIVSSEQYADKNNAEIGIAALQDAVATGKVWVTEQ